MAYKKNRRRIEDAIARAEAATTPDNEFVRELKTQLLVLESDRVCAVARRWGISDPYTQFGPWEDDAERKRRWLPRQDQYAEAWHKVSDARFEYIKRWVDLLSPILSLAISILAFALAALAIALQLLGKIH